MRRTSRGWVAAAGPRAGAPGPDAAGRAGGAQADRRGALPRSSPGSCAASRLTSLRRDEERSYRSAPNARPYYLCPALTSDLLSPARALLCVSTWPMEQRIVGPLSPRVDFLTAAIRVAEAASSPGRRRPGEPGGAQRLLRRFAMNIPGAWTGHPGKTPRPADVAAAAQAELDIHAARTRTPAPRPPAAPGGSSPTPSSCSAPA